MSSQESFSEEEIPAAESPEFLQYFRKQFGTALRIKRTEARLSQKDLEKLAGVPLGTISKIERGEKPVTLEFAISVAKALNTSVRALCVNCPPPSSFGFPKESNIPTTLGWRLQQRRVARYSSLEYVSGLLRISRQRLLDLESGEPTIDFSLEEYVQVALGIQMELDELFRGVKDLEMPDDYVI